MQHHAKYIILFLLAVFTISCKKYLEEKPRQELATPTSLQDLQAILDNENHSGPSFAEFVSDNFYVTANVLNTSGSLNVRKSYFWDADAEPGLSNWSAPYSNIYNCNFALKYLGDVSYSPSESAAYDNIKGSALYYRSYAFQELAQLYCRPYTSTAATDRGIVLRLTPDVNAPVFRSTVQETYDQIIQDLKIAAASLPLVSLFPTRPDKASAYAALARTYLSMRDYPNAGLYADSSLQLNGDLLDYNSLDASSDTALPRFINNPEVLCISYEGYEPYDFLGPDHNGIVDTILYDSYDDNDLRKQVFYGTTPAGTHYWKGGYYNEGAQTFMITDALTTGEMYLIRAESYARAKNKEAAMQDLNELLRNRWKSSAFNDLTATNASEALDLILAERRKELAFRSLRWTDLRRFNLEGANITLKRILNGVTYTLPPNDLRWVLLIPTSNEINRSQIPQNPR